MKIKVLILLSVVMGACSSPTDYYRVRPDGSDNVAANPDKFKVDSAKYNMYHANKEIQPPKAEIYGLGGKGYVPMTSIVPSDVWMVTHLYKGRYILQSESYNDRQCRYLDKIRRNPAGGGVNLLGKCLQAYEYGIYINKSGVIDGGWEVLPGSQKIMSARKMYLAPNMGKTSMWKDKKIFTIK